MTENVTPQKVDEYIKQYVELRDVQREIDEEYKEKKKEIRVVLDKIDGILQAFFAKTGGTNIKTKYGTAYLKTKYTASLADPESFKEFVIQTRQFELLDLHANSTAVREYVTEHNTLPPGVDLKAFTTVSVNRA